MASISVVTFNGPCFPLFIIDLLVECAPTQPSWWAHPWPISSTLYRWWWVVMQEDRYRPDRFSFKVVNLGFWLPIETEPCNPWFWALLESDKSKYIARWVEFLFKIKSVDIWRIQWNFRVYYSWDQCFQSFICLPHTYMSILPPSYPSILAIHELSSNLSSCQLDVLTHCLFNY